MRPLNIVLAALLCAFTLAEVNYPTLTPQGQLAIFAMLALVLCFLNRPLHRRWADHKLARGLDVALALLSVIVCGYVAMQNETFFERWWIDGQSLGNRAGQENALDTWIGVLGIVLVLEATRRSIGWALPILSGCFLVYAMTGSWLPDWMFPHRGYGVERVVAQSFLHTQGVFGTALRVMFTYVFLFVVFGALLKLTGATQFIVDFAGRLFRNTPGGPAKVAVLSSGMMGSLSGSAVANTATTGTFTIPLMRSSGFRPEIAAGVEAAASSGGALVPPVMGAGAYMMLEIVPDVTFVKIIRAALLPAILYYVSLLLIVHFYARRIGAKVVAIDEGARRGLTYEGLIFFGGFGGLVGLLLSGYTVFRSVSLAMLLVLLLSAFHSRTRLSWQRAIDGLLEAGRDCVPLVSAAACVGIIIGIVTLTGVGTKLPATVLSLSQGSLTSALILIMISSIVLGMGLPSAVCYLLMATLIGPVLGKLGVVPLGAHLFIFYFGMMSMVTPPVALAAYAAGSIAGAGIMETGLAAFRFALAGFTLPYMFVFRPELLMLDAGGQTATPLAIAGAVLISFLGLVPLAASIAGYLFSPLSRGQRALMFVAALGLLYPGGAFSILGLRMGIPDLVGLVILAGVAVTSWRRG